MGSGVSAVLLWGWACNRRKGGKDNLWGAQSPQELNTWQRGLRQGRERDHWIRAYMNLWGWSTLLKRETVAGKPSAALNIQLPSSEARTHLQTDLCTGPGIWLYGSWSIAHGSKWKNSHWLPQALDQALRASSLKRRNRKLFRGLG